MNGFNQFKNMLANLESGNNYKAVNASSGALGKYQFLPTTLNALQSAYNLPNWYNEFIFLNSPDLQELYFNKHIADLTLFIDNNNLRRFVGTPVSSSKRFRHINTSIGFYGLLAGAHLAGTGNLLKYLENGYNPDDGSTSLSDYIAYFSKGSPGMLFQPAYSGGYLIPLVTLAFVSLVFLYYE